MKKYLKASVLVIIFTNLIPLLGVAFLDWNIFNIIFLYWLEYFCIGFFVILKNIKKSFHLYHFVTGGIIAFIIFHLASSFLYLVFSIALFAPKYMLPSSSEFYVFLSGIKNIFVYELNIVKFASLSILLGIFYSFWSDKNYEKTSSRNYMGRILFFHIGLMFVGGLISQIPYFQNIILVLLILFKISLQINFYNKALSSN